MNQKQEKLERITIYLTKKEKKDAQIAAAHLELNMATLGRRAIQYLIYAPAEVPNVETSATISSEEVSRETSVNQGID